MRRGLLLLMAVAAGVLGLAPREAAAIPISPWEAERRGFLDFPDEPQPEVASTAAKPLDPTENDREEDGRNPEDNNGPIPRGLVALEGGSMQPSSGGGSGTGAASPSGLPPVTVCNVTVPSVLGQIVESRLLIPIRFLDGVFRPPCLS